MITRRSSLGGILGLVVAGLLLAGPSTAVRGQSQLVLQQNLDGYTGVTDTWFEYYGSGQYHNYGSADYLRFYNSVEIGGWRKIVLRFDLSDLSSRLPAGAQITGATLALYQYDTEYPDDRTDDSVAIFRMKRPWVEGSGTGSSSNTMDGAIYQYWNSPVLNPTGWVQNATYSNVWELTVAGTVDRCQLGIVLDAGNWQAAASLADVAATTRRWYQSGSTLYVNKNNSTTDNPSVSANGFSYFLTSDRWSGLAGTGVDDVDTETKIILSWLNYDKDYDPDNPDVLDGPSDWVYADVSSYVSAWLADPDDNYGLMVAQNYVGSSYARTQGRFFRSSEYDAGGGDYSYGPKLIITYISDTTAPAAITNLSVSASTSTTLTLNWTAPGDDGNTGTAASYDIRYSTSPINAGNWDAATQVTGEPTPAVAGTSQSMTVTGLNPNTTYYFAIKTADEVPNVSGLSNSASGTTSQDVSPVVVQHVGTNVSGWRGGSNISSNFCWLKNWPSADADGTIAQFDRTSLQNAINTIQNAYAGWDAHIVVTKVAWDGQTVPSNLQPVAASVDIDTDTLVWGSSHAYNAGSGNWRYDGTSYANFAAAVAAGVSGGRSVVVDDPDWTTFWDETLPQACWNVIIDVPESLIQAYLNNASADGLFVGAKITDTQLNIYTGDQWNQQANIRVVFQQPPQTAPWIGLSTHRIDKTISLASPTDSQTVTVTNAGTGTLAWSATENPAVNWLSIQNSSGGAGQSFTVSFDVTGLTVGTYSTYIRVSDSGAANSPQDIFVQIEVVQGSDVTAPAAVSDLAAGNATGNSIGLTWTAPGDDGNTGTAASYDIRYATAPINTNNWDSAIQVTGEPTPAIAGTVQSMTVSGLNSDTTYYFAIKTSDEVPNVSALSNVASAATLDVTAPAAVSDLTASNPTGTSITLTWTAPGDSGTSGTASSYDIRYSTSTITEGNWASATQVVGEPAPVLAGTTQSMTVSGLSADTLYYFAIKTADEVPNVSAISNIASAATLDVTAPAAVSNLAASNPTGNSITLTWTAPGDDGTIGTAASYDIRYSTSTITEGNWASATQVSGEPTPAVASTTQNMVVSGLNSDTTYYFAIKTSDEAANVSSLSNIASAATLDVTAPAAVSNLAVGNPTANSLTLTWTAPGDDGNIGTAASYDIRYSTATINEGNWASANQVTGEPAPAAAGTTQNMTVTGLNAGTTYYFAMKTNDEVPNVSALSNVASGATNAPSQAPITVLHIGSNVSGWRGGYNVSSTYCWLANWPNSNADATIGEFDRTSLQNAINTIYGAYNGWDAKIVISQVNWTQTEPPAGLNMVAGSADLDRDTIVWQSSTAFNAGNGNWRYNGGSYANFAAAVTAGAATGESVIATGLPYTTVWNTSLPAACWDILIDVPESMINAYLQNEDALGLFVSSTTATPLNVHANDQWSHQANIRVVVQQPPQTAPWIGLNTYLIQKTIALSSPTDSQVVSVKNAGTGTLNWTASENPDVGWLSISNGSGVNDGSFTVNFNVTGLTAGNTYTTRIRVAASGAGNTPQDISVSVKVVQSASPIIELSPTSLSYDMAPSDSPQGKSVTVYNGGLGSLNWTAAESPDVGWITLSNASGTAGQAFTVTVNASSLSPGSYSANISVSAAGATNSPQTVPVSLLVRERDASIDIANSYDDAWETGSNGWVQHCIDIKNAWSGKSDGFVVHVGDSITYASPYGAWARYGSGKTSQDANTCAWMHADVWGSGTNNSTNGWYLAAYDVPGRGGSFTAKSGIRADQYLAGNYSLPSADQMFSSGYTNPDGKQYRDAMICVLMLGTNDASANRTASAVAADLDSIISKMEAANVIVVLSTIPPKWNDQTDVQNYNAQIRALAQTRKLPLIDYYEEIVRRRPNDTWMNTLISSDGVHPSGNAGGYTASSDPYANGGEALSWSGYLLRDWLTVQKITEIRSKVLASATVWNVSTTAQLQNAVANYGPGDSIVIAAGTYYPTNRLYLDNGPVTVRGATGNRDDVVISGPGMTVNQEPTEMFDIRSDDVTIKDLTIRDVYHHGVHMRGEYDVDRTKLQNLRTINCGERHLKGSWNSSTPNLIQEDILIENCLIEQTQPNSNHADNDYVGGIDTMGVSNIIIRDNVIRGIQGPTGGARAGIFIWHHNTNPTIERNLIYNCDRGISLGNPGWAGPGPASTGGIIRNNMITRGANIGLELCYTDNLKVYYNTIYSADSGYFRTVHIFDDAAIDTINGLELAYNIIRGQIFDNADGTFTLTGNITGSDPWPSWFVNPSNGDLHLTSQATSAFNTGVLLTEVTSDFDQQARSSTPDKGADETSY